MRGWHRLRADVNETADVDQNCSNRGHGDRVGRRPDYIRAAWPRSRVKLTRTLDEVTFVRELFKFDQKSVS